MNKHLKGIFKPVIDASTSLPEITLKGIILGVLLAVILGAANAYLGLFAGMTISATIPAAVISMAVLSLFRRSNILENNIVMTTASAGEALAAGVIFTIPALILMDFNGWKEGFNVFAHFDQWLLIALIAGLGGTIGVLFTIPIRRALIINHPLKYPEGIATAEVLKSGNQQGGKKESSGIKHLVIAALIGASAKIMESGVHLWSESLQFAHRFGKTIKDLGMQKFAQATEISGGVVGYIGTMVSPALLAVGYIVGLNIAILVFAGGFIAFFLGVPLISLFEGLGSLTIFAFEQKPAMGIALEGLKHIPHGFAGFVAHTSIAVDVTPLLQAEPAATDIAMGIWSSKVKFIGVGAMIVGGIWTLIKLAKPISSGIKSGITAYKESQGENGITIPRTEQDVPMKWILVMLIASIAPLYILYQSFVISVPISITMAVLMLITGFLFSSVAAYMAGLVGSSNNPVSGVTIATILLSSLLLLLLYIIQHGVAPNVAAEKARMASAAILIGAVVCTAAAIGGDNLQDLKTGYLVGATPWKQQIALIVGVLTSALVMGPVLTLLHHSKGIGTESLPAPQADLMNKLANGVFNQELEWNMMIIGAIIGVVVIIIDIILERRNAKFRAPILAVAVGMYLPFMLTVPILLGGLLAFAVKRFRDNRLKQMGDEKAREDAVNRSERVGLLYAAGLITGEALIGILLAIPIFLADQVFHITEPILPILKHAPLGGFPGVLVLGIIIWIIYRVATRHFLVKK